jgi:hypothetical protein
VMRRVHASRVAASGTERTGILILRAWIEERSTEPLRLRITEVVSGQESTVAMTVTVEDACQAVRHWLEKFPRSPDSSA